MFSNNQKISIRQIRRLLILDLFGISSLLLPKILAKGAGTDGIFCVVCGAVLAVVYLWLLGKVLKGMKSDYYSYLKERVGTFFADIFMVFYLLFFLFMAAFVLWQLTGMVRVWLLPDGSYGWICFLVLLLAAYATVRGIEGRARIYEILFWFLGLPLVFMLVLAMRGINTNYWTPILYTKPGVFGEGIVQVFLFYLPLVFVLFLKPYCAAPKKLVKCAVRAVWVVAGLNVVIYLVLLGNFQVATTAVLERPVITLMSMVKLPGGFFARMDAFMTAIWFFSLFALMNTGVFYSSHILKKLLQEKKTQYSLLAILILVYGIAQWFSKYPGADEMYECVLKYMALPVLVLLPVVTLVAGKIRKAGNKE